MVSDRVPEEEVKVLMGIPLPLLSRTVKVTDGGLSSAAVVTFARVKLRPAICVDWSGIACAPMMEASNSGSPCGMWHCAHCVSSDLRQVHVIQAGGEIDVVVATAARRARWGSSARFRSAPPRYWDCGRFPRSRRFAQRGRGKIHAGEIGVASYVPDRSGRFSARNHRRQNCTHVEGVDEDLEIQTIAGVGVDVCGWWHMIQIAPTHAASHRGNPSALRGTRCSRRRGPRRAAFGLPVPLGTNRRWRKRSWCRGPIRSSCANHRRPPCG